MSKAFIAKLDKGPIKSAPSKDPKPSTPALQPIKNPTKKVPKTPVHPMETNSVILERPNKGKKNKPNGDLTQSRINSHEHASGSTKYKKRDTKHGIKFVQPN